MRPKAASHAPADRIRIDARPIDATTAGHLWAERYDVAPADVSALQDAVIRKIVAARRPI